MPYANESGKLNAKVAPTHGEAEVGGSVVLPDPSHCLEGQSVLELNGCTLAVPDAQFGDDIHKKIILAEEIG